MVNACEIWTFAWHLDTRAEFILGRDIFASLDRHLTDHTDVFCSRRDAESLSQLRISADPMRAAPFLSKPEFRVDVLNRRGLDATVKPKRNWIDER